MSRAGRYGMDAPAVPAIMAGTGLVALSGAALLLVIVGAGPVWALVLIIWAVAVGVFLWGCGRGAVLLLAARAATRLVTATLPAAAA